MKLSRFLIVGLLAVAACKSVPVEPSTVKDIPADSEKTLYVVNEDERFVPTGDETSRQVHYYSASKDMTYVIDERSGKILKTFESKKVPKVVVVDMEDEGCGCGCDWDEGCGCGDDGCAVEIEEDEGCGCGCG